jgi:hypothetical protein
MVDQRVKKRLRPDVIENVDFLHGFSLALCESEDALPVI